MQDVTFHNVTITINAADGPSAYTALCECPRTASERVGDGHLHDLQRRGASDRRRQYRSALAQGRVVLAPAPFTACQLHPRLLRR